VSRKLDFTPVPGIIAILVVRVLLVSVFFSDWMNMSIGMLVHEGSILVVILNGMRLLRYKLIQRKKEKNHEKGNPAA
jgi:Cd2+/Zn2+-exporting ATPase